ncbi:524_t:CDS:2, partial [Dentiscutata erythropus]
MKSMKLLASDRTIVGIAILHEECNQFHSITIPSSYCILSLTKCISSYPLEISDLFENHTNLSQLSIGEFFIWRRSLLELDLDTNQSINQELALPINQELAPPINQESVLPINQEPLSLSINIAKKSSFDNNLAEPSIIVGYTLLNDRNLGLIVRADIVYHRAGTASNKSTGLRTTRSVTTGCQFKVTVRWVKNENQYCIKSANIEHNHLLDSAVVIFDPGYRKLSSNEKTQIQVLHNSGIPIPTIVNMLTEEYSRYIHSKYVYNALTCQAHDRIKGLSQVAELLNNLQNKEEYTVTYSVRNNKLYSLFFTTSNSLMVFKRYPQIVLMDSTYKTNRFGMPLLLISGVDAIGITFLIASRLISNETISSFCWVLQQLKQVVGDITINKIQTILTDRDLAMLSSIRNELSHVKHQLYIWHLEQNIVKNLTGKLGNRFLAFSKDFKITMMQNTEEMFETNWNYLLIEYPEVENYMNKQWKPLSLPLPELINALDKLSYQQLQHSKYQQYRIRGSTLQQCSELLKSISAIVSNFTYSLILKQYNLANTKNYSIEKQDRLFK